MHQLNGSQMVFGSFRADVGLFLGTCVFAIVVALIAPHYISSHFFLATLIAVFDAPHVACGLYFMLRNSSKKNPALYFKILTIFFIALAACLGFAFFQKKYLLIVFFAHLSVWHFARQHQAWFKLAGKHVSSQSKAFKFVNNLASISATWLLVMASLCGDDQYGWFGVNDLVLFPAAVKPLFFAVIAVSLIAYFVMHLLLFIQTRTVMVSRHLVLLSMLVVWALSRHTPDPYLRYALIFMPHSMIYFYLLFKSTPRESLPDFKRISLLFTLIFGCFNFYVMTNAPEQTGAPLDGLGVLIAFTLAMSITHAFGDRLYWNSKDNPGWAKSLATLKS